MCEYVMKTNHCAYELLSIWQRCKIVSGSLLSPFSLLLSLSPSTYCLRALRNKLLF